jgi:hypothetical protein
VIGLYTRKDLEDFSGYYMADFLPFEREMLLDSGLELLPCQRPLWAVLESSAGHLNLFAPTWAPLSRADFDAQMRYLLPFSNQQSGRVLSLGLALSPPKSFSIAALAGQKVQPTLLKIHDDAVDFTLAVASQLFVSRAGRRRVPAKVLAYLFRHFLSRLDDPQLHSHLELMWLFPEGNRHAMDLYPLFFHQSALRACYHFELVAGLLANGYAIRRKSDDGPEWELDGVGQAVMDAFSKRKIGIVDAVENTVYGSLGQAMRLEALRSKEYFPKPETPILLGDARKNWVGELSKFQWKANRSRPVPPQDHEVEPDDLFARASLMTPVGFLGSCMEQLLGFPRLGFQIVDDLQACVSDWVDRGVLRREGSGILCNPAIFRVEEEVLNEIRAGLGKGTACKLVGAEAEHLPRQARISAALKNRIRVVAAGVPMPVGLKMEPVCPDIKVKPVVVEIDKATAGGLKSLFSKHPEEELLVWLGGRIRAGDFACVAEIASTAPAQTVQGGTRQRGKFSLQLGGRREKSQIQLVEGEIPQDPKCNLPRLMKRLLIGQRAVAVVGDDYPETTRRKMNIHLARLWASQSPWEAVGPILDKFSVGEWVDPGKWRCGRTLLCAEPNPIASVGCVLTVAKPPSPTLQVVLRKANGHPIQADVVELRQFKDCLTIAEPYSMRPIRGMHLSAGVPWTFPGAPARPLSAGDVITIAGWTEDGELDCEDGRRIPTDLSALAPELVVCAATVPTIAPDVVILDCSDPSKLGAHLRNLAGVPNIFVLAKKVESARNELFGLLQNQRLAAHQRCRNSFKVGGGKHPILPPREVWQPLIDDGIPVPGKVHKKDQEVEDEPEVSKTQSAADPPTHQRSATKKLGNNRKSSKRRIPADPSPEMN